MTDDVRDRLGVAHRATAALIRSVADDVWTAATPCEGWDVTALVRHLVAGERIFTGLVGVGEVDRPGVLAATDRLGPSELPAAYDEATAALRSAYTAPGGLDRPVLLPIGELSAAQSLALRTVETLTHGWDLTTVLGLPLDVPTDLVEWGLAYSEGLLPHLPAGRRVFGTPQPVAADAPALDRLAALLGRTVTRG